MLVDDDHKKPARLDEPVVQDFIDEFSTVVLYSSASGATTTTGRETSQAEEGESTGSGDDPFHRDGAASMPEAITTEYTIIV